MPTRCHLNRRDLAECVAKELRGCKETKAQRRLLAARMAARGQFTAAQIAEQFGVSRRRFFAWMNAADSGWIGQLAGAATGGRAIGSVAGSVR